MPTRYERRYLHRGEVAHLITPHFDLRQYTPSALCGVRPQWLDDWRGTGTQDEHDKVDRLPTCKRCAELDAYYRKWDPPREGDVDA